MRIIACLVWYDEKASFLAELVASLGKGGIDHIVAVDGAYAIYPDAKGNSGSEQADVIASTALGAGMGVTMHQPRRLDPWWGNEVEKRTALFTLAHHVAEPGVDWLLVADADEILLTGINRIKLEAVTDPVVEFTIEERGGKQFPMRKLFRAHERGITVQGYHARYLDGDGNVLWGPSEEINTIAADMWDTRIRHRPDDRHSWRRRDQKEMYRMREALRIEQ